MTVSTARPAQAAKEKRSRGRPACSAIAGSDALLKSARRAFAKRGFESTSVREIARDSGVDPALISHHFGSKEALWIAVVEQIAQHAAPMIDATGKLRTADLTKRQRVERALAIFIDKVFSDPDIGMFFSTTATEQARGWMYWCNAFCVPITTCLSRFSPMQSIQVNSRPTTPRYCSPC